MTENAAEGLVPKSLIRLILKVEVVGLGELGKPIFDAEGPVCKVYAGICNGLSGSGAR